MPSRIEDYALIGDCRTAALVSRAGSIDWLCLPRFDSPACFAALLGTRDNGRWLIAPRGEVRRTTRRYREGTLVLDTEHETEDGAVVVTDCMPVRTGAPYLVRRVEGKRGRVSMHTELVIRFDYGSTVPWVRRVPGGLRAVAGPSTLRVLSSVEMRGKDMTTVGDFVVGEGERATFVLAWYASHLEEPPRIDVQRTIEGTERFWRDWSCTCERATEWHDAVVRSFVVLKALIDSRTGGMVAAPTTSLPENVGGTRNWDYRYCWVRDATFTLMALAGAGYLEEARAWREWLLRAVAGDASKLQIMYAVDGSRRLLESEIDWLAGFEGSRPVRIGNAAHGQRQLDVYGELLDVMHQCYRVGLEPEEAAWNLQRALLNFLETHWHEPDEGIWEVRGPRQQFTHSKVMAWVALDRGIKTIEGYGTRGPVDRWREARGRVHEEVCRAAWDAQRGAFVQAYGSKRLDASLLMMPLVGFLPATDARVRGTVAAIERELLIDGFVRRYLPDPHLEGGIDEDEGAFLPCTFWLADNYALGGREADARRVFERLLALRNDVGLLSEEYEPRSGRLVGNFPQAFSHVSLIDTAHNLSRAPGPARRRHGT